MYAYFCFPIQSERYILDFRTLPAIFIAESDSSAIRNIAGQFSAFYYCPVERLLVKKHKKCTEAEFVNVQLL